MGDYSGLANRGWDISNNPLVQEQNAQAQALAQAQIDAILAAGGSPSADLIAQSGYSQEYVNALRNAYLRELAGQSGSSGPLSPALPKPLPAAPAARAGAVEAAGQAEPEQKIPEQHCPPTHPSCRTTFCRGA